LFKDSKNHFGSSQLKRDLKSIVPLLPKRLKAEEALLPLTTTAVTAATGF
jgi:hypothetical protein